MTSSNSDPILQRPYTNMGKVFKTKRNDEEERTIFLNIDE